MHLLLHAVANLPATLWHFYFLVDSEFSPACTHRVSCRAGQSACPRSVLVASYFNWNSRLLSPACLSPCSVSMLSYLPVRLSLLLASPACSSVYSVCVNCPNLIFSLPYTLLKKFASPPNIFLLLPPCVNTYCCKRMRGSRYEKYT